MGCRDVVLILPHPSCLLTLLSFGGGEELWVANPSLGSLPPQSQLQCQFRGDTAVTSSSCRGEGFRNLGVPTPVLSNVGTQRGTQWVTFSCPLGRRGEATFSDPTWGWGKRC